MDFQKSLPKVTAFVAALNEAGITSAADINKYLSLVVGQAVAADHVNKNASLVFDDQAKNRMSNQAWRFNNFFSINYDLAIAKARDVINTAYNEITSKGYTTCTDVKIPLGESEVSLFDIPEAHALFVELVNRFSEREDF
ncbi:hypothetical protein [Shewanella phage FishSpeaker]|nr:hypothetical protein [Shewanella phage FishSpeaker]